MPEPGKLCPHSLLTSHSLFSYTGVSCHHGTAASHGHYDSPNLRCYEYIAVYVDDLCIVAESPSAIIQIVKSKYHLKVKGDGTLTYHLGADYFEDPDGTFVSQPKKYIDK